MKIPFAVWAPVVILPLVWAHKFLPNDSLVGAFLSGLGAGLLVLQLVSFFRYLEESE